MGSNSAPQTKAATLVARVLGTLVAAGACITLVGWFTGMKRLTDWEGSGISMFVNTALMVLGVSAAIVLRTLEQKWAQMAARVLAVLVVLLASATLFQHATGVDLHIDELVFTAAWGEMAASAPGRPGLPACTSLLLLAAALLLSTGGPARRKYVPPLAIIVCAIATLSLVGYSFGASRLYALARFTGIAFQTTLMLLASGIATLALIPERALFRALHDETSAGMLTRRVLPLTIIVPILLGWMFLWGRRAEVYDRNLGIAFLIIALIALLCVLLWWCAGMVREREFSLHVEIAERQLAERQLAKRVHEQFVVYQFTDKLQRIASLGEAYDAALDGIRDALHADRSSILLFDETGVMKFVASRGLSEGYRRDVEGHSPWKPEDTVAEPFAIEDLAKADMTDQLRSTIQGEGIASLAFIPLMVRGKVAGKFMTYYNSAHRFTREEFDLALTLARHLGFAIERRRAEEETRTAAAQAEAASRAKDDFLAALSHELRTPLTPVLMTLTDLEGDSTLSSELTDCMTMMARNIRLEARLIDDLLDLTRITRGKLKMDFAATDAHAVLTHALETVREAAESKRIVLRLRFDARERHVNADPVRLQQVFWNLLKNAVKFTPAGGTIDIRSSNPGAGTLEVIVEDTGIGIRPDVLPRIFQPFEQGGLEGRHEFGGLGLGLTISKAIVDAHGGTMAAASEGEGKGATFKVELRTTAAVEKPVVEEPGNGSVPSALTVLVVDDHEPTLDVISRLLERDGHRVLRAGSVKDALTQAAGAKCDLLISDLGLPDGTGFDLMSEIRTRHGWPGIALSGYGMECDIERSVASGFRIHLTKPVDLADLRRAIGKSVSR